MNQHTNKGGILELQALLGLSPYQRSTYLMLLDDLPATPWNTIGANWLAVETDMGGYSRVRIDSKMGVPAANGSVVETSNTSEVRITSSGAPTSPIRAYAVCDTSALTAPANVYFYGYFDKDHSPANGTDFVIAVNAFIVRAG